MSDLEYQERLKQLMAADEQVAELYQVVEDLLNYFGKENALYPTRAYVQVDSGKLQKLARVYYEQINS